MQTIILLKELNVNIKSNIEEKIKNEFKVDFLEVVNESNNHAVPANSETHFKVTLVSNDFEGVRLIARHRLLNALLKYELENGVHALALHTYTSDQWQVKNNTSPISSPCLGGGK